MPRLCTAAHLRSLEFVPRRQESLDLHISIRKDPPCLQFHPETLSPCFPDLLAAVHFLRPRGSSRDRAPSASPKTVTSDPESEKRGGIFRGPDRGWISSS